jgi:hypothetical protein
MPSETKTVRTGTSDGEKRTAVKSEPRAKLLAVTATGPIYRVPAARFAIISLESALYMHSELASKALNPKAKVCSSLAARVEGTDANTAWLLQTSRLAVSLTRLEARGRLQVLRQVVTHVRKNGVFGNETVVAAAINAAWPWLDTGGTEAAVRFTKRAMDRSNCTDEIRCIVVDPSARSLTLLDPGQLKSADPTEWLDWRRIVGQPEWTIDGDGWQLGAVKDPYGVRPSESDIPSGWGRPGSYGPGDFAGPGGYQGPGMGSGGWGPGVPSGWGRPGSYGPGDFAGPGGYQGPGMGSGGYGWSDNFNRGGFGGMGMQRPGSPGGPLGFGSFPGLGGASDFWGDAALVIGNALEKSGPVAAAAGVGIAAFGGAGLATGVLTIPSLGVEVVAGHLVFGGIAATAVGAGLSSWGAAHNANDKAAGAPTPAPAAPAPPAPKPEEKKEEKVSVPVVVIPTPAPTDPPPKEPHSGDLYPDPDGGGTVDPTRIWEGDGGIGPTTIWDGDSGVGPATIWDENSGGGTPTTTGTEITAPTLAGRGLAVSVVQVSANTFAF